MASRRILEMVCAAIALGSGSLPVVAAAGGREDVPPEIAARENPVADLPPARVSYYAKQFKAHCARCHGIAGDGAGAEAAAQALPPANFTDAAYLGTRSDGQLFYQILVGGKPRSAMPAYGPGSATGWSEDKIWGMVAYVRRFAAPDGEASRHPVR